MLNGLVLYSEPLKIRKNPTVNDRSLSKIGYELHSDQSLGRIEQFDALTHYLYGGLSSPLVLICHRNVRSEDPNGTGQLARIHHHILPAQCITCPVARPN